MSSNRRLNRQKAGRQDGDKDIMIAVPSTFKEKPILLTEPKFKDLAPYGPQMLKALRAAYEQGLEEPCVLVIWRGGAYAQEHGLDTAPDPLVFRPISGPELERLTGIPPYERKPAAQTLPTYVFGLALKDRIETHISLDLSPDGIILSWKFSPHYRRDIVAQKGIAEEGIAILEKVTGIGRND